jgi:hypothetical protein
VKSPDSEITIRPSGTRGASVLVVSSVVSNVFRSRLLMPMSGLFSLSARSSSAPSCTSISASIPQCRAASSSSAASPSSTLAMMIRMQSAPQARASATW